MPRQRWVLTGIVVSTVVIVALILIGGVYLVTRPGPYPTAKYKNELASCLAAGQKSDAVCRETVLEACSNDEQLVSDDPSAAYLRCEELVRRSG